MRCGLVLATHVAAAVNVLPDAERKLLKYISTFLQKVHKMCEINRMSALNLATIFGPSMLDKRVRDVSLFMGGHCSCSY